MDSQCWKYDEKASREDYIWVKDEGEPDAEPANKAGKSVPVPRPGPKHVSVKAKSMPGKPTVVPPGSIGSVAPFMPKGTAGSGLFAEGFFGGGPQVKTCLPGPDVKEEVASAPYQDSSESWEPDEEDQDQDDKKEIETKEDNNEKDEKAKRATNPVKKDDTEKATKPSAKKTSKANKENQQKKVNDDETKIDMEKAKTKSMKSEDRKPNADPLVTESENKKQKTKDEAQKIYKKDDEAEGKKASGMVKPGGANNKAVPSGSKPLFEPDHVRTNTKDKGDKEEDRR
eukprot:s19_g41.t1